MKIPCRVSRNGVTINVRVQPRSSRKKVERVEGDLVYVKLTAPPAGGAANAQLIELLAKTFGIRKSAFSIIKGRSSRNKVLELEGSPESLPSGIARIITNSDPNKNEKIGRSSRQ